MFAMPLLEGLLSDAVRRDGEFPAEPPGGLLFSLLFRARQSVPHKREKRSKREKMRFLARWKSGVSAS